jgi:hypothetical protein
VYAELPIETNEPQPLPRQQYVVLGIFRDHERLLEELEEVIVYIDGSAKSKHSYSGTRRLFRAPIWREMMSFGLEKVIHYASTSWPQVADLVSATQNDGYSFQLIKALIKPASIFYLLP